MDTVCWCNDCYARRFPYGENDRRKFDNCPTQQALDYAFEANRKRIIELEEQLSWEQYERKTNG